MRERVGTRWHNVWADVRRSFADFLLVPSAAVALFLVLALGVYALDRTPVEWLEPARAYLQAHLVTDPESTRTLLGTIAGGVITVTSITFSLLLLAVQQSAAALTAQVLDQFLRRRLNQLFFGVFVGIALFVLVVLATTDARRTPVFGATSSLLLMLVALSGLVLLLYATINQMRPDRIVEAVHDLTLAARDRQRAMLRRTRRTPEYTAPEAATAVVRADTNGYVVSVHLDAIGRAAAAARGRVEVVLHLPVGTYVCYHDVVAEVRAESAADAEAVGHAVRGALAVERQRAFHVDPGYGVSQLSTIAWTSVSTARSNPAPGLAAMRELRDLLARWSEEEEDDDGSEGADRPAPPPVLPVVYRDDVILDVLDAFESLAVVASESMQHQSCAEVVTTFALMFGRLPPRARPRAEDAIERILSSLGDQVLTADLERALERLTGALAAAGRHEVAGAVQRARAEMRTSVGRLNSRATRVPRDA